MKGSEVGGGRGGGGKVVGEVVVNCGGLVLVKKMIVVAKLQVFWLLG